MAQKNFYLSLPLNKLKMPKCGIKKNVGTSVAGLISICESLKLIFHQQLYEHHLRQSSLDLFHKIATVEW